MWIMQGVQIELKRQDKIVYLRMQIYEAYLGISNVLANPQILCMALFIIVQSNAIGNSNLIDYKFNYCLSYVNNTN